MDLGSVINDCGDKHYNTGDASGYLYVMQMGRHDHPRSIVTDHYLLDSEGVLIPDSLSPANDDQVRGTYLAYGISLDLSSDLKG